MTQLTTQFGTVFHHERRLFRADRLTFMVALILMTAIGYAIFNGVSWVNKQQQAVHAAQTDERTRVQGLKEKFTAMNEGKFTPKSISDSPANPLQVGSRHAATYAIMPLTALAATAIGQGDLNPPYIKVSASNKDTFAFNDEIENPSNLLIGHFDLAFVLVFLLPLLVIALSYNLLSVEREQGTLPITLSNSVSLGTLLIGKIVFRAALVFACTTIITVASLMMAGTDIVVKDGLFRLGWWTTLLFAYGIFWFALAMAVNTLGKSSAQNALILIGLWIVFLLIIPSLISVVVNRVYPIPPRTEMVGMLRAIQTDVSREYDATTARSEQTGSEEKIVPGILDSKDYSDTRKRIFVQQASVERNAEVLARYDHPLALQQSTVDWLRYLSPAILLQEALNNIAGTDSGRYRHFYDQVDLFHRDWQAVFLPKALDNTPLTLADYEHFPRFSHIEPSWIELNGRMLSALLGLLIPIGLLYLFSMYRVRDYTVIGV
jgi:ABC-2 type transport system permease protein